MAVRCLALLQEPDIFFQHQSTFSDDLRVRYSHVTEVPGLLADPGDVFLPFRISLDETVEGCFFSEYLTDSCWWKFRADKVYVRRVCRQVDGEAGFMLAASGDRYIFS